MRKPPIGSEWRILAHDMHGNRVVDIHSSDYGRPCTPETQVLDKRTIFDELVITLGDGHLHLEQMSAREWCLILGDEIRMLTVDRNGRLIVGEMYK